MEIDEKDFKYMDKEFDEIDEEHRNSINETSSKIADILKEPFAFFGSLKNENEVLFNKFFPSVIASLILSLTNDTDKSLVIIKEVRKKIIKLETKLNKK